MILSAPGYKGHTDIAPHVHCHDALLTNIRMSQQHNITQSCTWTLHGCRASNTACSVTAHDTPNAAFDIRDRWLCCVCAFYLGGADTTVVIACSPCT